MTINEHSNHEHSNHERTNHEHVKHEQVKREHTSPPSAPKAAIPARGFEHKKFCPIRTLPLEQESLCECLGGSCAWWSLADMKCATASIALSLDCLLDQITKISSAYLTGQIKIPNGKHKDGEQ